jgi:thiamine-phosphate pyrophosphorylase
MAVAAAPVDSRTRLAAGGLYLLTPPAIDARWVATVLPAVLAEAPGILQLRLKPADSDVLPLALRLRELTLASRTLLIVNDDVALALACRADGVHLGRADMRIAAARDRLGAEALIGATCHADPDLAETALAAGADYLAFGAIHASTSKPAAAVCGLAPLRAARARFRAPLVAIGGITVDRAAACLEAGADWLAVIAGVWASPEPAAAVRAFHAVLAERPCPGLGPT